MQWEVRNLSLISCNCKCNCTLFAVIVGAIIGVIAAFLQITGLITITTVLLAVAFGIGIVYLLGLLIAASLDRNPEPRNCTCASLNATLVGILGTILFSVILIAVGITATSVISAILVGLLVFSLVLMIVSTACLIRTLTNCDRE